MPVAIDSRIDSRSSARNGSELEPIDHAGSPLLPVRSFSPYFAQFPCWRYDAKK